MKTIVFLSHFDGNLYLFRLPIMRRLSELGWRVIALVPRGNYSGAFAERGIEHIHYRINRAGLNPFGSMATIIELVRKLKAIKPDILHCFTVKPNLYGAIAGKFAGVKTTYATVTGMGSFFIERSLKARLVSFIILCGYRLAGRLCAKILFQNSDDLSYFVDRRVVPQEKAKLLGSSGIDTDRWQRSGERKNDRISILFVGRLIKHKGIFELLEAAANLKARYGESIEFVIVGASDRGNLFNADLKRVNAYGRVASFVGAQDDVWRFYNDADIFVLPSYREGVPRTVLEAMSMSLPVVTTDAIGCRETIEQEESGLFVPIGDSHALEKALERLIDDRALREKMGKAARCRALKLFDIKAVINRYLALYEHQ
ncbi:MAG: glycosyltransferase family 4 protein [Helicobacteraceae bacterium]|jgi:N,N'-diacetylbacillosaminyl-diphospho-undecaprenol alpha-1,3-N-acetylgalactosaminyltransferase|nr:glycosyltransferase family 4 protein [Helicobacteraceae bacterium]